MGTEELLSQQKILLFLPCQQQVSYLNHIKYLDEFFLLNSITFKVNVCRDLTWIKLNLYELATLIQHCSPITRILSLFIKDTCNGCLIMKEDASLIYLVVLWLWVLDTVIRMYRNLEKFRPVLNHFSFFLPCAGKLMKLPRNNLKSYGTLPIFTCILKFMSTRNAWLKPCLAT